MNEPIEVVDACGLLCPLPVIRLTERVRQRSPGDEIVLLADDPMAEEDVRLWAAGHGHEVVAVQQDASVTSIRVRIVASGG